MPAVKVSVAPAILRWVSQQSCADFLNDDLSSRLSAWLDGTATPTFSQIENISKSTGIPLGYFFLNEPPVEETPLLKFRSIENDEIVEPSRELLNTIHQMENIQDWIREYKIENAYSELNFVGSVKNVLDAKKIADKIKSDLGLADNWHESVRNKGEAFKFIRSFLNNSGITVMMNGVSGNNTSKPLSVKEFRAFALVDNMAPLIFINGADSEGARLFSLLHEAVHVWLGVNDLYNDWNQHLTFNNKTETLCNAVAAQIIIPDDAFEIEWKDLNGSDLISNIEELSNIFHCSTVAVARKAYDFGKISNDVYNKIAADAIEKYKLSKTLNKSDGGNYYSTMMSRLDMNFFVSLCASVSEGKTSYSEAFRLTNTNSKTFTEIAHRMGVDSI